MARMAPFEEVKNGLPVWRLSVEDPEAAASAPLELVWKSLHLPNGGVFALAIKLRSGGSRPQVFHHALAQGSMEMKNLRSAEGLLAVFERHGWLNVAEKSVALELGTDSIGPDGGSEALAYYVEAYRRLLPLAGSPEGVWQAIQDELNSPSKSARASRSLVWIILIGLLVVAVAIFFLLKH